MIVVVILSCVLSLTSVALTGFFYLRFSKQREISHDRVSNEISGLLNEFHSVSNENIELLEDRTEELRRVVDLADLKAKKLNRVIDQAEGLKKVLQDKQQSSTGGGDESRSHREQILSLAEEGYSPAQIAEKTGIKPGEVSVIIRLNRSRLDSAESRRAN